MRNKLGALYVMVTNTLYPLLCLLSLSDKIPVSVLVITNRDLQAIKREMIVKRVYSLEDREVSSERFSCNIRLYTV